MEIVTFTPLSFSLYESCQTCQKSDIYLCLHVLLKTPGGFTEKTLACVSDAKIPHAQMAGLFISLETSFKLQLRITSTSDFENDVMQ